MEDRLAAQLAFLLEADRLKSVLRQSELLSGERRENSAEHSWHIGLLSLVLAEYAAAPFDPLRVLKMCLLHDLVEIDAGDTFCYDTAGMDSKAEREARAAERIFGLLPEDQALEFRAIWEEFEAAASPEARFANAVDRIMPMLHNLRGGGRSWNRHGVSAEQVVARNGPTVSTAAPEIWQRIHAELDQLVAEGLLPARQ